MLEFILRQCLHFFIIADIDVFVRNRFARFKLRFSAGNRLYSADQVVNGVSAAGGNIYHLQRFFLLA